ncbi:RAD55 family ATPase [[Eubacterium] cellulosolvens]
MFLNTIPGFENIFKKDILPPKVILVSGVPGSLKSSFVYTMLTKYVQNTGEFGLYATLEESTESYLNNMESLGVEPSVNLQISDYTDFRGEEEESIDYLQFTEKMIGYFKETRGEKFTCFGFDSLGALYSLMGDSTNMRKRMYHFFHMLRQNNLISFIVMERSKEGESHLLGNEGFLSDGIIVLGLTRRQGKLIRYIQIEKMRATQHNMEYHAIDVGNGGISILGPIFE